MTAWLFCQHAGQMAPVRSVQSTREDALDALLDALRSHRAQGRAIDPPRVTGEMEHRYAVRDGIELIAVYWLSEEEARSTL